RRRHTSFSRDWSSDVCSSDLVRSHRSQRRAENGPQARPPPGRSLSRRPTRARGERTGPQENRRGPPGTRDESARSDPPPKRNDPHAYIENLGLRGCAKLRRAHGRQISRRVLRIDLRVIISVEIEAEKARDEIHELARVEAETEPDERARDDLDLRVARREPTTVAGVLEAAEDRRRIRLRLEDRNPPEALHVEVLVAMIGRAAPALHEAEKGVDHGLPDFIAAEMRAKKPETARRSVRTAKATDHARLAPRPHL